MHRHPPRHGARANISMRSSRRWANGSRRPRSATRAPRTRAWARWSASASATTCATQIARARSGRRADRRGRSQCRAADPGRRVPAAGTAAHRRSVGHRRGPRLRAVRAGLDDHAVPRHRRRDRARQPRHGQPGAVAVHPLARRGARVRPGRGRLPRPDAGHRPRPMPPNRPATARRCRSWSTAAPAAPAAARRWAACAASSITCSAPRSSPRRR